MPAACDVEVSGAGLNNRLEIVILDNFPGEGGNQPLGLVFALVLCYILMLGTTIVSTTSSGGDDLCSGSNPS
jgi:hypothetical protein